MLFPFFRKVALITITFCMVTSGCVSIVRSQSANAFAVPCTVDTYGNAWNGTLAFDLIGGSTSYLVIMDTNGTVLDWRGSDGTNAYGPTYEVAHNTLLFEGEPAVDVPSAWPTWATNVWNLTSNTAQAFPNVVSEHDIQYDPVNHTFLTLQDYVRQVGNDAILYDKVIEVNAAGNVLWTWDTYDHIPLSQASPFDETAVFGGENVQDFTHANSLDWDYANGTIYLNIRNTNTFYKIDQTSGEVIWACGEFGNFTLLNATGQPLVGTNGLPPSLWYHCHDVKQLAPDVFTLFDNDYNNNTDPSEAQSSLKEITLNETTMTAQITWGWVAPRQYYTTYGGATIKLPNGDWIGDFGDPTHQFSENQPWDFHDTGAVFAEVNAQGQIIRTFTFPVGWYVYRIDALTNITPSEIAKPTASSSSGTLVWIPIVAIAMVIILIPSIINSRRMKSKNG